ncbi:uncharacterized protein L201_004253 [Kwoniella dendrophila CBS 6074]|uniref:RING-type domain-containing protein n=1 Tax=Kwoniella dendrophila CBS 6074 TaxID=1295534 RepID=A0AAX4JVC9_9TREE
MTTSPAPSPSSPPIKWRGHTVIFSPPKHVDIRSLVMKDHPTTAITPSSSNVIKKDERAKIKTPSPPKKETKRAKRIASTIIMMGPNSYEQLELSSSDGSSNDHSHTTYLTSERTSQPIRSKTVSPIPALRKLVPASSVSERAFTPSPNSDEQFDGLEYSDPQGAYDEYGSVDQGTWSEGGGNSSEYDDYSGSTSPVLITPEDSQPAPRLLLSFQDLMALFDQPPDILPPTPPSTPQANRVRRSSKSPALSVIPSVSTASSPLLQYTNVHHSPSSFSAPGRLFRLESLHHQIDIDSSPSISSDSNVSGPDRAPIQKIQCSACGKYAELKKANKMIPCGHIACSSCFSSTLAAVSPDRTYSQCVAYASNITTFERIKTAPLVLPEPTTLQSSRHFQNYTIPTKSEGDESVIMRIDNIAWDMTPEIVETFDGRTKDYLYIEVASLNAAEHILQTRQNTHMPGGLLTADKKRPVTITIVSHAELVSELRPHSSQELQSMLNLCHMALGPPTPASRFVKSRHGPFLALMSVMSKLTGRGSPAYWDLFRE